MNAERNTHELRALSTDHPAPARRGLTPAREAGRAGGITHQVSGTQSGVDLPLCSWE